MLTGIVYILATGAVTLVLVKMVSGRPSKSHQAKIISLFLVIALLGVFLVTTQYNGLKSGSDAKTEIISSNSVAAQDAILKSTAKIQEELRQQSLQDDAEKVVVKEENTVNEVKDDNAVIEMKDAVEKPEFFYGVMIDAGSTGSRVHAFKFKETVPGKPFHLEDALFKVNHEGLSSFADEPAKGAENIGKLLDEAKEYVPQKQWSQTPLALKATAGLRALPKEASDALLQQVEELFNSSVFKVGPRAVTIMDGDEEGIFSWFTLNFLMGTLGDRERMVGAMDLGGGSTQITFVTTSNSDVSRVAIPWCSSIELTACVNLAFSDMIKNPDYIEEMDIFGEKFSLYTHSYLGLGLMAGKFQTLGGKEPASEEKTESFKTPCVAGGKTIVFPYQGENFNVTGIDVQDRFAECQKLTDNVVRNGKIDRPKEVSELHFTIFSYYYDRAVDAKLIDAEKGGDVQIQDFINAAKKECELLQGKDFLCLDLTYISSLLTTGFNFQPDTQISLRKKVDNFEVSWALGAMFHLLKQ